jgi:hypothetical protein
LYAHFPTYKLLRSKTLENGLNAKGKPMTRITIKRVGGKVVFEEVSIYRDENVFFINEDPDAEHWPTLASNQLGKAPSAPSSQCQPDPTGTKKQVYYQCKIAGHANEQGCINIFEPLSAAVTTLKPATKGQSIPPHQLVQGGVSPYTISGRLFEVVGSNGAVIQSGSGVGPGLQLIPTADNTGVWVNGTPTLSGTYNFTFTVDDAIGGNLQQVQYSMEVSAA